MVGPDGHMRRLPERSILVTCAAVAALAFPSLARAKETDKAAPPPAPTTSDLGAARADPPPVDEAPDTTQPSALEVDYAQYGVALAAEIPVEPGGICPERATVPCIIGLGGGPVLRGGYRPAGPWYFGGAYQFSKLDSNNLYRLGILQQLRGEMRYFVYTGSRVSPYVTWGLGGMVYGNEFGVETGGVSAFFGGGFEFEVSRAAIVGANIVYRPVLLAGYTDAAGLDRSTGIVQFLHLEFLLELRTELHRE